jgi:hypothetical protein
VSSVVQRDHPADDRTSWLRTSLLPSAPWVDPLVVGLVALVVYGLHGFHGELNRDKGVFTYGGIHVAQGTPPYVDIFNSVGPLADAVPGLAIRLGSLVGVDPVLSERLFFTVISALCCSLVYVLARDTVGSRAAGMIAAAAFLTFEDFTSLAAGGPSDKTTMVLFLLGCLILLGRRRWALAGACAALGTLTWQPVLAVAAGALVAAALVDRVDTRLRILTRFTLGGLVPTLAAVCYFVAADALSQAIQGFVVVNVGYAQQPSALTSPGPIASKMWDGYHWTFPLAIAGLVLLLVLGARAALTLRRPTASPTAPRLVICTAGALVATAWTLLVVNGAPDLFVVLPFAALGLAAAAVLLAGRLRRGVARPGIVVVVGLSVLVAGVHSVTTRDDGERLQRADVQAVLGTQPADAVVVSLSAPQVLALSGRDSPVPYQIMSETQQRYLDATYPGGMPGFLDHVLVGLQPTFVVVGSSFRSLWHVPWLDTDYWKIGSGSHWTWYLNRSAGRAALLRARSAHDRVMAAYRS